MERHVVNASRGPFFGEWLVKRSLINRAELFAALNESFIGRCRIGDAVVRLGLLRRTAVEREAYWHRVASPHGAALRPLPLSYARRRPVRARRLTPMRFSPSDIQTTPGTAG